MWIYAVVIEMPVEYLCIRRRHALQRCEVEHDSRRGAVVEIELFQFAGRHGWEAAADHFAPRLTADDETSTALKCLLAGWVAVERTKVAEAADHFAVAKRHDRHAGWAHVGDAMLAVRIKDFAAAEQALTAAASFADDNDVLRGMLLHIQGTKAAHEGNDEQARTCLYQAVALLGPDHYMYGRALDTLGNLYLNRDNFLTAKQLFHRALECKERVGDRYGAALTHGQLGRLYLHWGYFAEARRHFYEDLRLAEELRDDFGRTRMQGALGQVSLSAARHATLHRETASVADHCREALDWLTQCIASAQKQEFRATEGFARKDLALVHALQRRWNEAEAELEAARTLFAAPAFDEGLAHVDRVAGIVSIGRRDWEAAERRLQAALSYFLGKTDRAEAAATRIELARLAVAAGSSPAASEKLLREALRAAEGCRRTSLVSEVEHELQQASPAVYWAELFQRVRGRRIDSEATTFIEGSRDVATILYLDLQGWSNYSLGRDPEEIIMTINQMMADAADVLRRHAAQPIGWRGDGFLAMVRGEEHARRAVETGLDLVTAVEAFNEPRRLLGLPEFRCRIGISTGETYLGNVGTYEKMDFSGVGTMMNLGARLEAKAEVSRPCICERTHAIVGDFFTYATDNPRRIEAKGIGDQWVWDVVGRANAGGGAPSSK